MHLPECAGEYGKSQVSVSWPPDVHRHFAGYLLLLPGLQVWGSPFSQENKHPPIAHDFHSRTASPWKPNEKVVKVKYSLLIFIASPTASSHVCSVIRWGGCLQPISRGVVVVVIKVTITAGISDGRGALNKTAWLLGGQETPFIMSLAGQP